jgi:hypothetical protein
MPEDLKDIDARLHALQQFLKQVSGMFSSATRASHGTFQAKQKSRMGR